MLAGTRVRVAITLTVSLAGASRRLTEMVSDLDAGTSRVCSANPAASTRTRYDTASGARRFASPSGEVVWMADGVEESERNNSTCAPATAAAWGSITLILRSAADAAASKTTTEIEIPKNRMHSSFVTRKGLVWTVHAGLLACE